ncbi:MAG: hypothetical protein AAFZ52_18975, partial [Bacteroidota bacterium]
MSSPSWLWVLLTLCSLTVSAAQRDSTAVIKLETEFRAALTDSSRARSLLDSLEYLVRATPTPFGRGVLELRRGSYRARWETMASARLAYQSALTAFTQAGNDDRLSQAYLDLAATYRGEKD